MQYLLSQEEYTALLKTAVKGNRAISETDLQDLCTKLADSYVLTEGYMKGKVWGCILTKSTEWYCDDCYAQEVCPCKYKNWSQ